MFKCGLTIFQSIINLIVKNLLYSLWQFSNFCYLWQYNIFVFLKFFNNLRQFLLDGFDFRILKHFSLVYLLKRNSTGFNFLIEFLKNLQNTIVFLLEPRSNLHLLRNIIEKFSIPLRFRIAKWEKSLKLFNNFLKCVCLLLRCLNQLIILLLSLCPQFVTFINQIIFSIVLLSKFINCILIDNFN